MMNFRTDLASEANRIYLSSCDDASALKGLFYRDEKLFELDVSSVEIADEQAASALGKAIGKYYTLELPRHFERGSEQFADCVHASAELIERCMSSRAESVLVAALGNPDITPDSLGPLAASGILVTRHLKKSMSMDFSAFASLCLCRTGVLGTSGIESAAHIKYLAEKLQPELLIVIDALAGAESDRLCRTIQFTNTGIAPGSGVGNDREELSEAFLGFPVIAVGMPTVLDAGAFSDKMRGMFVTPRGIDSLVRSAAKIISYAVNVAVHNISIEDVDMLAG